MDGYFIHQPLSFPLPQMALDNILADRSGPVSPHYVTRGDSSDRWTSVCYNGVNGRDVSLAEALCIYPIYIEPT